MESLFLEEGDRIERDSGRADRSQIHTRNGALRVIENVFWLTAHQTSAAPAS